MYVPSPLELPSQPHHFFELECSCFTMSYSFLLYNKVKQLYIYTHIPPPSPNPPVYATTDNQVELLCFIASSHYLNILQLGDDMAKGLGVNVEVTRIVLTAIAALLAASAVSVVGLLGFVGLVIPHVSRLILGSDYRFLIPGAALLGIAIVTLSDTFARVAFAPVELPVGIIMAFIGAPFFLFLLRREL